MPVLTIRLPDEKHERLKALAKARGISLNKLIEELSTIGFTHSPSKSPKLGGLSILVSPDLGG